MSLLYFLHAYAVVFGRPAPEGPWLRPALLNVAIFSAFALHHSLFARLGLRAAVRRLVTPALERSVYVWLSSALFLGVCLAWQPVPGVLYELDGAWRWPALAAQIAGLLTTYLGSKTIDALDLAGIRQVQAPDLNRATQARLETGGLYALVRHPIYFGWLLIVFGAPTMTATRFVFAGVSTVYLLIAIPLEERGLVRVFGEEYGAYRRRVRSRIVPGIW